MPPLLALCCVRLPGAHCCPPPGSQDGDGEYPAPPPLRVDADDGGESGGCYEELLPVSMPPHVPRGLAREEEDEDDDAYDYEVDDELELMTRATTSSVPSRGAPGLREDADEAEQLVSPPPHGAVGSRISAAIASVYERLSRTFSVLP